MVNMLSNRALEELILTNSDEESSGTPDIDDDGNWDRVPDGDPLDEPGALQDRTVDEIEEILAQV